MSVYQLDSSCVAQVQSKVRAAFAAGASGKKKLNKREQKDVRGSVRSSDSRRLSKSRPLIVSPAQLETEAETAAERLLEEIDANQDAEDGEDLCGNQIYGAFDRPPRHRRDTCSRAGRERFLTARRNQRGHVIAEK